MALSPTLIHSDLPDDPNRVDNFSNLPDELIISILSLLCTRDAVRTSILARRFGHLWESSTSINIFSSQSDKFVAMADHALLQRNLTKSLLSLRLSFTSNSNESLPVSLISSCLIKARNLNLRHLIIHDFTLMLEPILPIIFSINSLESLDIPSYRLDHEKEYSLPAATMLTCLRSLRFLVFKINSAKLNRLLSELCCLEDLHLEMMMEHDVSLSSHTIRKLKVTTSRTIYLGLYIPTLELLHYESSRVPCFRGEIPSLREVVFIFDYVGEKDINARSGLLKYISHAEKLTLEINEDTEEMYPFPLMLEPGKVAPMFSGLKHLDVTACFHDFNLEAVVILLHHSPALESVRLVHKPPASFTFGANKRKKKDWASKLPRNADGNRCYAYFTNLHSDENSEEFMKLLNKKFTPERKRMKPQSRKCTFLKNRGLLEE
ncbi:F-box/FBD/LRR protein [Rhynchospora pubera]|uniref:F-box/FBD/LRR protein n=1 Tax=Rhynchospora pubera TaxID=906938 RepID=A0AAV8CAJ3_9POAL|nr:F-box/FBD/LRR protein [Rhynchospora pubera]